MSEHDTARHDEQQQQNARRSGAGGDRSGVQGRGTSTGPPLVLPVTAFVALFTASLVVLATSADGAFPSPYATDADVQAFFAASGDALQVAATLQFAAAVPLAVLAATVSARLHVLGARAPGATIALAGGLLASVFLAASALLSWTLSRPEVLDSPPLVRGLHVLAFLSGGPAHVVGLGLLLAGIAVPALLLRFLPRPVAVIGLVLAVLAELCTLALVVEPAAVLLPLARFPALIWLLAASILLPATRRRRTAPDETGTSARTAVTA